MAKLFQNTKKDSAEVLKPLSRHTSFQWIHRELFAPCIERLGRRRRLRRVEPPPEPLEVRPHILHLPRPLGHQLKQLGGHCHLLRTRLASCGVLGRVLGGRGRLGCGRGIGGVCGICPDVCAARGEVRAQLAHLW